MPRLSASDARDLLHAEPVARLATVDADGRPHLVPITFAVHRGTLYSAVDDKPKTSRDLRRIANVRANPKVAVLVDHYDDDWSRLWWVRVDGHASVVADPDAMAEPLDLLAERYPRYRERRPAGPVLAVRVESWTGWRA